MLGLNTAAQESARDLVKLLISLASAVVAISVTFVEKLSQGAGFAIGVLFLAWISLACAVVFGVNALSKLVHAQRTAAATWSEMTFPPMRRSWRSFQLGIVLLLCYAGIVAGRQAWRPQTAVAVACCPTQSVATPAPETSAWHPASKR